MTTPTSLSRLSVVDALRGFAIVSIMLLHNIEHFDFYYSPTGLPDWMLVVDKGIWETLFFLFSGKSYAIFALLFGLTFFIQSDNQEKKGYDFRGRFAWRLVLLLGFGLVNSAFYQGDILAIYALIGFFLIPVSKLSNRLVFGIALFLMLQPYEWFNLSRAIQHPDVQLGDPVSWSYFGKMGEYITGTSFFDTVAGNLTNGKPAVLLWNWENGRVFQTLSLFMFGMLAGRKSFFVLKDGNKKLWRIVFFLATLTFIPLFQVKNGLDLWIESEAIRRPLLTIVSSWSNMAFMMILVSGFVLAFQSSFFHRALNLISPIGRMSLSNYIIQSVIGSTLYYGFGFALYLYTGATYCLLIGLALALLQGIFSTWWMNRNAQGPLETLWHRATWIGSK